MLVHLEGVGRPLRRVQERSIWVPEAEHEDTLAEARLAPGRVLGEHAERQTRRLPGERHQLRVAEGGGRIRAASRLNEQPVRVQGGPREGDRAVRERQREAEPVQCRIARRRWLRRSSALLRRRYHHQGARHRVAHHHARRPASGEPASPESGPGSGTAGQAASINNAADKFRSRFMPSETNLQRSAYSGEPSRTGA